MELKERKLMNKNKIREIEKASETNFDGHIE